MAKRTITLTGRPPVTIDEEQWPVIASARDEAYDSAIESQSNRTSTWLVRVRRHHDGRAIVYAVYEYDTRWQGERSLEARRGVLLPPGTTAQDICDAIRDVCRGIASAEHHNGDSERWSTLIADCIADMPAETLQ